MTLHEDYEVSCRFLAQLIEKEQTVDGGPLRSRLLLQDFATKIQLVRTAVNLALGRKVLASYAPRDVREIMQATDEPEQSPKGRVDVLIVAIIEEELRAAKSALGITKVVEDDEINGIRVWRTQLEGRERTEPVSILVAMVGQARNVECAVTCSRLLQEWHVDLAILVGIAAGLKGLTKVGDVVRAELVLDYEGARAEVDGLKKRPMPYPLDVNIGRNVAHFSPEREGWHEALDDVIHALELSPEQSKAMEGWKPSSLEGVVLSGEKLLADGSLPAMQAEYSERVRAAEMEGSGFARACREYGTPWLVFRGVSDYGDQDKPLYKPWKLLAAASAATATVTFIRNHYRRPSPKF